MNEERSIRRAVRQNPRPSPRLARLLNHCWTEPLVRERSPSGHGLIDFQSEASLCQLSAILRADPTPRKRRLAPLPALAPTAPRPDHAEHRTAATRLPPLPPADAPHRAGAHIPPGAWLVSPSQERFMTPLRQRFISHAPGVYDGANKGARAKTALTGRRGDATTSTAKRFSSTRPTAAQRPPNSVRFFSTACPASPPSTIQNRTVPGRNRPARRPDGTLMDAAGPCCKEQDARMEAFFRLAREVRRRRVSADGEYRSV
jgi:hypothetical protein